MKTPYCVLRSRSVCFQLYLFLFILVSIHCNAQDTPVKEKVISFSSMDEVPVEIHVEGKLTFETNALITDSNLLYVNVIDLFKQLKINCNESNKFNGLEGYIENERKLFSIDYTSNQIQVGNKVVNIKNSLHVEMGIRYIESSILSEAFGLTLILNPKSLSVKLTASFELPYVREIRIENSRNSIAKLQGHSIAVDTVIPRNYHLLKGGMVDWALNSNQTLNGSTMNNVVLGLGAELLYGETNISINYNDNYRFNAQQLQYNWRWIDNNAKVIKQAQVGKISSQSIAFLESPVVGVMINNSPNTVRKAKGTYRINEYTEPNWTVELYINDVLIEYKVADASGLYFFNVPIVYGYTTLKLKFYGPLGEERIEERILNTPYTFMPAKTFEYSISGGILQGETSTQYGQGNFSYGLNRFITLGAGVEYLSSIIESPFIPFAKFSIQPFSKLILNVEYAHEVRLKGLLNYYLTKSALVELDFTKYDKGQRATRFNALEERKVKFSMPFKLKQFSGFSRLNFNQFVYDSFTFNQIDFIFSSYYKKVNINSSTLINWIDERASFTTTNLSLSYRFNNGIVLRPSVEYNVNDSKISRYRTEIEKRVSKSYFSASYERFITAKNDAIFLNFRYDFDFARTGLSSFYTNRKLSFSENAQGSVAFGGGNKYVHVDNTSSLGKGGILFYPFLDLNQNGILDKGEKMVLLNTVRVSGGSAKISKKDSIVRVSNLNAFVDYNVEFSNTDLQNISWKFKYKSYQVLVDPNQYKRVYVPIISMGEMNGTIYLTKGNETKGVGRITVKIYDYEGRLVKEILSEADGYFSYLGLIPGKYRISLDEEQLKNLNFECIPKTREVVIGISEDGDIIEGLDFQMTQLPAR